MHGRNTFSKKINGINRKASRRPKPQIVVAPVSEIPSSADIGDWRITQDEDGSLILYNFETGNRIVLATP